MEAFQDRKTRRLADVRGKMKSWLSRGGKGMSGKSREETNRSYLRGGRSPSNDKQLKQGKEKRQQKKQERKEKKKMLGQIKENRSTDSG